MTGSLQKLSPSPGFHTVGDEDTANWKGIPVANGTCEISLNDDNSVRFTWSGGNESGGKNIRLILAKTYRLLSSRVMY